MIELLKYNKEMCNVIFPDKLTTFINVDTSPEIIMSMIFVSLKLNGFIRLYGRYITSKDELMSELPTPVDEIYINILKLDSHVEQIDSIPCNELKQNETLQYERYLKKLKNYIQK